MAKTEGDFWFMSEFASNFVAAEMRAKRIENLDRLYTEIQMVSGHTPEKLLEFFKAGYTLEPPCACIPLFSSEESLKQEAKQ